MRSLIATPPALAVAIAVGCSRDPHVASPTAEPAPSPIASAEARPPGPSSPSSEVSAASSAPSALAATSTASPPPAPIDGALPSPETLALSNKASCPTKTCRLEGSLLEAILGAPESRSPAAIWEEDLGPNATVAFARRADMDVLGVALSGSVTLVPDESKTATELAPWHAFVAPGSGLTLRAKGAARIVLVLVSAGETPIAKVASAKGAPWTSRPAPIASLDLATVSDLAWGKGAYHARIGFGADASPHASMGLLKMSADSPVAPHVHEKEWEHMAILQGEGDFTQGTGEDEHVLHATGGVSFSVPPATRHQWKPAGSRAFIGIQLYTPPGPEQRFKKLAAGT